MGFFKEENQTVQLKLESQLKEMDQKIIQFGNEKRRIVDLYASGDLERDPYVEKSLGYDNEINKLKMERKELIKQIPLLHKTEVVNTSIQQFCQNAKLLFEKLNSFESKRQFLLDHIEKIVFFDDETTVVGSVPVRLKAYDDPDQPTEVSKIEFRISGKITRKERVENWESKLLLPKN